MRAHTERPGHHRLLQEVVRIIRAEPQYRSVVSRVLAAERHYSQQAVGAPERQIIRFQTAKMLFYAAIDKGAAFRTVERRFREVLSLSGGELLSDVAVHVNFGDYCGCQGQPGAGIRPLEHLQAKLNRLEGSVPKGLLAYCRGQIIQLLRRLRKGQVTEPGASHDRGR
jgi:hypothetical protein